MPEVLDTLNSVVASGAFVRPTEKGITCIIVSYTLSFNILKSTLLLLRTYFLITALTKYRVNKTSHPVGVTHQGLTDIAACSKRFKMTAVVDELHFGQVQSFQLLLTGPIHHVQLLSTVHQQQRARIQPLRETEQDLMGSTNTEIFLLLI